MGGAAITEDDLEEGELFTMSIEEEEEEDEDEEEEDGEDEADEAIWADCL
jgi:hypothetical protein